MSAAKRKPTKGTLATLWPYIRQMRPHLGWVLAGSLLGLVTLLASIGLLTLSGWFISATALAGVSLAATQSFNYFTPGAGVRGFAILRTVGRYLERITTHEATFRLIARLRSWLYRHIEPLGPAELSKQGSAQLLSRLVGDIQALDNLYLRVLSPSLIALLVVVLVTLFLALYSSAVAWVALTGLVLAGLLLPWLGYRLGAGAGAEQIVSQAGLRQQLLTLIQGLADLRIYGGMGRALQRSAEADEAMLATQNRMATISALTAALMLLVSGTTLVAVLWVGLDEVAADRLQPVQLALVLFCVLAAFEAVSPLPLAWQYLGKTRTAAERLNQVIETEPAIRYGEREQAEQPGRIEFHAVSFAYTAEQPALDRLELQVAAGEKLLLAGHSGSGKSSLLNLLSRFWDPQSGQILLGGQPIAAYSEQGLRRQFSVVSQPVQLFAGSVRDNLQLGRADAGDDEMRDLLERLGLLDELGEAGLDYPIGEAGGRLSGGQRKRLALARALLRDAPILLLDEPTEGLDGASAQRAIDTLLRYRPQQTVILISHHLQALERFDRVVLLDRGRILEQGSPQQLLAQGESRLGQLLELH